MAPTDSIDVTASLAEAAGVQQAPDGSIVRVHTNAGQGPVEGKKVTNAVFERAA